VQHLWSGQMSQGDIRHPFLIGGGGVLVHHMVHMCRMNALTLTLCDLSFV
jgi:hypothetical protein